MTLRKYTNVNINLRIKPEVMPSRMNAPHLSGVPVRLLFCPIQHFPYPICAGHLCDESEDWPGSDDSKKEEARWQKLISIRRR